MTGLTRDARPLLSMVGGKQHATNEDHDETHQSTRNHKARNGTQYSGVEDPELLSVPQRMRTKQTSKDVLSTIAKSRQEIEDENSIYAEPVSDDELLAPPTSKSTENVLEKLARMRREADDRPKPDAALKKPPSRSSMPLDPQLFIQKKRMGKLPDTALRTAPGGVSKRKHTEMRAPRFGAYQKGQAHKTQKGLEEDKESISTSQSSLKQGGKEDTGFGFDPMAYGSSTPKKQKTMFGQKAGKTRNIHANLIQKRSSMYGKNLKPSGRMYGTQSTNGESEKDDESDSDVPMKEIHENKLISSQASGPKSSVLKDKDLSLPVPRSKRASPSSSSARLFNQLGEWKQEQSSPLDSSIPQEELDKMEAYVAELKGIPEITQCTLCKMTVDDDVYADFWYGKKTTVKNQTAFCSTHKKVSANEEYESAGYPKIDWDALPMRVKKHRKELYRVLTNDRPSKYRDRYEPIALTGKAGAIRSRRNDRLQDNEDEDENENEGTSFVLDDYNTFPGYYGPRGRRSMTETIMKELRNEIKSSTDAVVQTSGPAAFVQAVLVPEVAILLIMEDNMIDDVEAEQIRETTYDMGLILHEEIEDEVDVQDESDDETEYSYR